MTVETRPLLVGFVADLMFMSQIERVTAQLGWRVEWVADSAEFGKDSTSLESPGEPIYGQSAALVDSLSAWQPALIVIDLDNDAVPWRRWLPIIKSSPATRRLPVLAFGAHVNSEMLESARQRGADQVVGRSRFSSAMPELFTKLARTHDGVAAEDACRQPLHPDAVQGIALFNAGDYYEAHHGLEAAWNADEGVGRDLYRAILQVAVAYLQIERRNYRGAIKMFLRVRQWLSPLPDECRGVDVAQLKLDAETAHAALLALGESGIADFNHTLFKPVVLLSAEIEDSD
jgi:CheY-like chemotaxis protein